MPVPFVGTNRKQTSWNKHASDAVLKSMNDSAQPLDQAFVTGPSLDLGESAFSSIVAAGGGRYVGVLKEIPDKMESLVLPVQFAPHKNNPGHSDFAFNRGGRARASR